MRPAVLAARFGLLLAASRCALGCGPARDPPEIAPFFGTKTRYEDVRPQLRHDPLAAEDSALRAPPADGCAPVHLTAVIRHGSRLPTAKNIRAIRRLSELVRTDAARRTERGLDGWDNWYTEDMDGRLVEKGRDDLRLLARRLAATFPALLSQENLLGQKIQMASSSKHRCLESAEAFQQGLQQHWGVKEGSYNHQVNDELMRFFERCHGYVQSVEKNRSALLEEEKFKRGEEMEGVRRKVAERLGLPLHRFGPDLVEAAFFLCSYELSIKSVHSPWCSLFDEDDAKVLEYKSDLKQYWKRSHGHAVSGLSSCPLFHHIFRTLDRAGRPRRPDEASAEPASVLVGHAETLLPLLALLGLHKDQVPPTAHNYHAQHARRFRSGLLVPYAANLLFVLWDCRRGPRLQLLLNETPLQFPGLQEEAPLYRDVRASYRHLLDGCDFHKECLVKPERRGPNTEL